MRELIRKILRESVPPEVRRRIPTFDDAFIHYRDAFNNYTHGNFNVYWWNVMERVLETLYHAWFTNTVPDDEWEESEKYIKDYLTEKYYEDTKKWWSKHGNRYKLNESFTGDTPTDITKQFNNKPVKLIGDVSTSTKIQNINVNNDGSVNISLQNGMKVNSSLPMLRRFNLEVDIPLEFKIRKKVGINESEDKVSSTLNQLVNVLFDGFDNADYDWANYNCGMGECCDPYAIGFTLPENDYDDYIFKLVDGEMYDDDAAYPEEFQDELPEPCYQQPDLNNPRFDTIVFYGLYAEEIEEYMGDENNWKSDLLKIINNQFGCDAKRIIII